MRELKVAPQQCVFCDRGLLTIRNVGAGLGIVIFAPQARRAAGLHLLRARPASETVGSQTAYVSTAIPYAIAELQRQGATPPYSVAVIGGGSMLPLGQSDHGDRMLQAAKEAFFMAEVPIKRQETGGAKVRSITLNIEHGKLRITEA